MSISKVFYALMGDKSTSFESAEIHEDHAIFHAHLRKSARKCPSCFSLDIRVKQTKERVFRMLNLGGKKAYLKVDTFKIWCGKCNTKAWLKLPFSIGKLPMTRSFIQHVIQLTAITTLLATAIFLALQWNTVKKHRQIEPCKTSQAILFQETPLSQYR